MKYIAVLIVLFLHSTSDSQVLIQSEVQRLFDIFRQQNLEQGFVMGWKIQLLSHIDRREIESEKQEFERSFPGLRAEWHHDDPYYVLQIANLVYIRELDAQNMFHRIKDRFPSAILVLERLRPETFLKT